ncbi:tRNA (N(6)-L-threonylcarbamoyladenosine(37)-C(2))-methylthiotransferase MtaB [Anaerosacchariphilus polymeriproducens]|uniref:Threonylcarbamoyladenosine tRNA methylthiotransferase MtaB n=1 Tax=Anaerosacchariphilus polymeriproducens TaxID=1812858 RepID=A0A371ASC4_9FIRM|nr:tRNA (N(6)-L-threonylcarbamoyladenosine(37)-C(2))-methylthiotransferase MtaB [Anaerosacchariphilus polymeriproducens]RDU22455.1 tRNA (N(6)-L-threonylcarbamoyladenosine(37)-C(2))-methylthiotransferase MtaB [Anaerosacchariphilus polymeriproducens]
MKKAALHNLGCKVNAYETDAMQKLLKEGGYEIVPFSEVADVYIINTCSVTNMADRKSRQMIHKAKKKNPEGIVIATGCYVQTSLEDAKKDLAIDIIIGNNKKCELISIIEAYEKSKEEQIEYIDINSTNEYEGLSISSTAEHTRAYIKVQDGCNQFCSYCIIPYARGRVRSRNSEEVLEEVRKLVENGYKEVVLTGIHLSSYGIDLEEENLLKLIIKVNEIEGIERIRLGSLEPRIITEEFVESISSLEKICPHFHLSLQSGCDETLKRMNRHYTTDEYLEGCNILRKYFENPGITTDVIVGFPGETEEEFNSTKEFLEKVHFSEMHIFKYSKRKGTKAAEMVNHIAEDIKTRRSNELIRLEKKLNKEYMESYIGKETEILIEEELNLNGIVYQTGHTKEYIKAAVEDFENEMDSNQIIKGKIKKILTDKMILLTKIH